MSYLVCREAVLSSSFDVAVHVSKADHGGLLNMDQFTDDA